MWKYVLNSYLKIVQISFLAIFDSLYYLRTFSIISAFNQLKYRAFLIDKRHCTYTVDDRNISCVREILCQFLSLPMILPKMQLIKALFNDTTCLCFMSIQPSLQHIFPSSNYTSQVTHKVNKQYGKINILIINRVVTDF